MFSVIYGAHDIPSGRLSFLVRTAYYEVIKKVKAIKPSILNTFSIREAYDGINPFVGLGTPGSPRWEDIKDSIYELTTLMYKGIVLKKVDRDRIEYLNENEGSIFGGRLTPCYSLQYDEETEIAIYPSSLKESESAGTRWSIYYIPSEITVNINSPAIRPAPPSLFITIIKQAVVIQLETDMMDYRNKVVKSVEELQERFNLSVDSFIEQMATLTEEGMDTDVDAQEYDSIRALVSEIDTAINKIAAFIADEDIEMVQGASAEVNAVVEKIRSSASTLSEKWAAYAGVRQLSAQAAIGSLNAIANIGNSMQGSTAAFVANLQGFQAKISSLLEEINNDIAGA